MEEKHKAGQKAKVEEAAASVIAKRSSKKRSASGNPGEQVPKKGKPNKFFQHCKAKGEPHLTHNTKRVAGTMGWAIPWTQPLISLVMQN
jgi:hypothetical protein